MLALTSKDAPSPLLSNTWTSRDTPLAPGTNRAEIRALSTRMDSYVVSLTTICKLIDQSRYKTTPMTPKRMSGPRLLAKLSATMPAVMLVTSTSNSSTGNPMDSTRSLELTTTIILLFMAVNNYLSDSLTTSSCGYSAVIM